ncbi:MAG: hypothetical protein AB7G93_10460 [Bdellovibrionales bacterium]
MILFDLEPRPYVLRVSPPASGMPASEYVTLIHRGTLTLRCHSEVERYRLLSRVFGASWSATRLERDRVSANFQGNPLWPKQVLQNYSNLSYHFGLTSSVYHDFALIPLAETINTKLRQLSAEIGPTSEKEFVFESVQEMSDRDYVDMFINNGRFPMAALEDRDSIHDWSYHFLTMLFGEYLENVRLTLACIRDQLGRFQGRVNRTWNYYGHKRDRSGVIVGERVTEEMTYENAIYRQMAISMDVVTAQIVQLLYLERKGRLHQLGDEFSQIQVFFDGVSMEAFERILWLEDGLTDRMDLPPPEARGWRISASPFEYLSCKLVQLDRAAKSLCSEKLIAVRRQAFRHAFAVASESPIYL